MNVKNLQSKRKRWLGLGLALLMCSVSVSTKAQCIALTNAPTGTFAISPYVQTLISTTMFPGNYAIINITNPGEYAVVASFGSFFTVTDNANTVIGSGNNTLYQNFTTAGLYRIHLHSSSSCGTTGGSRIVTLSPRNNTFNFDGSNDYINVGTSMNAALSSLNKITAEAWVYPTNTTFNGVIIGNYSTPNNQMQFCLRRSGTGYQFFIGNGTGGNYIGVNAVSTVTLNTWQHVAGTWDGAVAKIYINGALSGTASVTYPMFNSTANSVWIGSDQAGGGELFAGNIDEVRVWTRAVCQGEIQNNMNGAIATAATGLLANYHFNQGVAGATNTTVTTLNDDSGNSYNGTVTNATLTGTTSNWIGSTVFVDGAAAPAFVSPTVAISGNTVICSGNSTTLNASGNVTTYNWVSGPATSSNVVTPVVTTSYSVTGTNSAGCVSNMATKTVSVNTTPTVSVNNGTICSGNSFTIIPTGANTYTIQGGNTVVTPVSASSYTVVGTSAAGCVSANTATSNVTVNTTPTVSVNSGTICSGNSFTIVPSGASSYTIQGGSTVVTPSTNTSYTVVGSSSGCMSMNTATSTVTLGTCSLAEALNTDGINDYVSIPQTVSGDFTIEYWLNTTATGQTGPQWYFGNGLVDAEVGGVVNDFGTALVGSNVAFGIGNPDVSIFSTSGVNTGNWVHVAATWEQATGAMKLYINGTLEASGSSGTALRTSPPDIKIGVLGTGLRFVNINVDEIRIWNTVRTACQINTYKNCEIASGATGLVANYHFNQGYAASVNSGVTTLTDVSGNSNNGTLNNFTLNGTTSNWIAPGAVVTGSTTPLPPPTVGATVTNSGICPGGTTMFSGTGAVSYVWTGGISNGVVFSPTATAAYTVTGTAATGCTNTGIASVTVNPLPIISVNSGSICNGGSFTITPTGANTYTLQGGNSVVSPTSSASYTVMGTSAAGCVSANTATSNVTVNALPTVNASTSNSIICSSQQTATLSAVGATTYSWSNSSTGASIVVSPSVTSSYTVTGADVNGCTNSAVITQSVSTCTGINNVSVSDESAKLYPNPNNGVFTLEIVNLHNATISIIDVSGRVVISAVISEENTNMNLQSLQNGIYFIQVNNNNTKQAIKFIKN